MSLAAAFTLLNPGPPSTSQVLLRWERAVLTVLGHVPPQQPLARHLPEEVLEVFAAPQVLAGQSLAALQARLAEVRSLKAALPKLHRLASWWQGRFEGDLDPLSRFSAEDLRLELRQLRGIGPTLADQLTLYVFDLPVAPLESGLIRITLRHRWTDESTDDEEWQSLFRGAVHQDATSLRNFHAALSPIAKHFCTPSTPQCDNCPLASLLPAAD